MHRGKSLCKSHPCVSTPNWHGQQMKMLGNSMASANKGAVKRTKAGGPHQEGRHFSLGTSV